MRPSWLQGWQAKCWCSWLKMKPWRALHSLPKLRNVHENVVDAIHEARNRCAVGPVLSFSQSGAELRPLQPIILWDRLFDVGDSGEIIHCLILFNYPHRVELA